MLMIHPLLTLSTGYDDNIFAGPAPRGAWQIATRPSVLIGTENSTGSAGLFFSADDVRYPGEASQNRTDGAAFAGGTINLGRDKLTLGAGYLSGHEDRTALDASLYLRPAGCRSPVGQPARILCQRFRPASPRYRRSSSTSWRFGDTTILGAPVSEASCDRTMARPEMALRYNWMSGRDVILVGRVLDTHYDQPAAGVASNNSVSWEGLLGLDYDDNTVWRYRLLAGVQYRVAASATVASETTGIAEAEITWSPSGMTTVRAIAVRGIEDAAQAGLSTFTYNVARLTIDHEALRSVLLNGSATVRQASYNTGGQQYGFAVGAGVTWLINRNARLSLTYDFADVRNANLPVGTVAGDYTRSLALLTLRVGL